ncbi:MAG: hypothetical protein V4561_04375 [Bacteroidota bacterium]
MARKDEILKSFLTHPLLETKYEIPKEELPATIREAIKSEIPIIHAIALIVEGLDGTSPVTDSVLRNQVTQFLNEAL